MTEAEKYHVLPIDDRTIERMNPALAGRPDVLGDRKSLTLYEGMQGMMENTFMNIKNRSSKITAELEIPAGGHAKGAILSQGGRFGGWSLYMKDGKPAYTYNFLGLSRYTVTAPQALPPGPVTVTLDFAYDGGGAGKGGKATLYVNGKPVAEGRVEKTQPNVFSADETADVGMDNQTPVAEGIGIGAETRFTGKINKITLEVRWADGRHARNLRRDNDAGEFQSLAASNGELNSTSERTDMNRRQRLIALALLMGASACGEAPPSANTAAAEAPANALVASTGQKTPGYNNKIPEKIMTPDKVETPIGTLDFFDGMPSESTAGKVYDFIDLSRGVETFLNGIPATSIEGMRLGFADLGVQSSNQVLIFDKLADSNALFLTANTETVYTSVFFDLKKDGPTVIEVPPGSGPGTVNDAFFRFVVDMGGPGPDRGAGGKYLILPPDYKGTLTGPIGGLEAQVEGQKYFVAKSPSYVNWLVLRGFLVDGKPDAATAMFKQGLKVYPLAQVAHPPAMEFISASGKVFNTIHANNYEFYEELHTVIEREPVAMPDPELRGLFASVGIQKGKPFAPDARMKKILTNAVAIGNATVRATMFRPRLEDAAVYPKSAWTYTFVGGSHEWLGADQGSRYLDARALFFYQATVNTPAMVRKMVGLGSQYVYAAKDTQGNYLDGAKNYTLNIPTNAPAKDFWSVVVYDPQTRSELQTSQPFPSKNSRRDKLIVNADGSVDLYFGPKAPAGKEANWTQTVSGKGWFAYFRLYGPLEPWFAKSWRPGEITETK